MLVSSPLPHLVVGIDPDSTSTALAWALLYDDGYRFADAQGGGSRSVTWQTVTGARAWLAELADALGLALSELTVVIETQAPAGPQSTDVEELRRVRYHWQAACEIDGVACEFVDASIWQPAFVGERLRGAGSYKKAYQRKAKALTPEAVNEDRCAAIGILSWYVSDVLGSSLIFG